MPTFGTFFILFAALGQAAPVEPRHVDGFRLQDYRGGSHALDDVRDRKLVVLAFLGVDCPLANQYAPRLAELARAFEAKGVAFFGIDANQQDGPTAMGRFANANHLPFPFLKDVGNELADRWKVGRTPEVLVLDATRTIRYRGRIDDQFELGVHRPSPSRRDLAVALEELLAGRPVSVPKTEPIGCRIGRVRQPGKGEVTYFEASRADPQRSLRRLPPARRDRPVRPDHVQAGRRLGRDDRRGRERRPHAPLACQPRVWQVSQRRPPDRR